MCNANDNFRHGHKDVSFRMHGGTGRFKKIVGSAGSESASYWLLPAHLLALLLRKLSAGSADWPARAKPATAITKVLYCDKNSFFKHCHSEWERGTPGSRVSNFQRGLVTCK